MTPRALVRRIRRVPLRVRVFSVLGLATLGAHAFIDGSAGAWVIGGIMAVMTALVLVRPTGDEFRWIFDAENAQVAIERLAMPESSALMVTEAAVLFALYGDFEGAQRELDRVKWMERHPFERVAEMATRALIELVSGGDVARARNYVRRAEQLADQAEANHALRARVELVALKGACELLTNPDAASVEVARMCTTSKSAKAQLISQWALGVHFWREEERDQAAHHFAICKRLAPYCLALHGPPEKRVKPG